GRNRVPDVFDGGDGGLPGLSPSQHAARNTARIFGGPSSRGAGMRELMEMPATAHARTDPRRQLLAGIFRALNESGVPWCIVHGYEQFSTEVPTDVDVLLGAQLPPARLAKLLNSRRQDLNARVVQWLGDGAQWI